MKKLLWVLAANFAFAIGIAIVDDPSVLGQVEPAPVVQPASPAPQLVAEIQGPEVASGTFMVEVKVDPRAVNNWSNNFPLVKGMMFKPRVLPLRDLGHELWWFQDPPRGLYIFKLRSQLPNKEGDGLDPIIDLEHGVLVGPAAPVVVDPTTPVDPTDPVVVPDSEQAKVKEPGFRCLLLSEHSTKTPDIFFDPAVIDYLNTKCVMDQDGKTRGWRRQDNDSTMAGDFPVWRLYRETLPPGSVEEPQVACGNGVIGYSGPAPQTAEALLALLKKYGG
jgi:hypothetical protein